MPFVSWKINILLAFGGVFLFVVGSFVGGLSGLFIQAVGVFGIFVVAIQIIIVSLVAALLADEEFGDLRHGSHGEEDCSDEDDDSTAFMILLSDDNSDFDSEYDLYLGGDEGDHCHCDLPDGKCICPDDGDFTCECEMPNGVCICGDHGKPYDRFSVH